MSEAEYSRFIADFDDQAQVENEGELRTLFELSASLRNALSPVNAAAFKASLRERIVRRPRKKSRFAFFKERQNAILMAVAAAGSLLSITGVVLLVLRRIKSATKAEQPAAAAPI